MTLNLTQVTIIIAIMLALRILLVEFLTSLLLLLSVMKNFLCLCTIHRIGNTVCPASKRCVIVVGVSVPQQCRYYTMPTQPLQPTESAYLHIGCVALSHPTMSYHYSLIQPLHYNYSLLSIIDNSNKNKTHPTMNYYC